MRSNAQERAVRAARQVREEAQAATKQAPSANQTWEQAPAATRANQIRVQTSVISCRRPSAMRLSGVEAATFLRLNAQERAVRAARQVREEAQAVPNQAELAEAVQAAANLVWEEVLAWTANPAWKEALVLAAKQASQIRV